MRKDIKVGFIGAGNMASALVGGMIDKGLPAADVTVSDPDDGKTSALRDRFGVSVAGDNAALLQQCDVVVLAVKPQVMREVLSPLSRSLPDSPPLIVSVAAGIRVPSIEQWLGRPLPVIRVMPNTPSLVGLGASGLYANERVSPEQRETAETLMQSVGITAWVDDEPQLDTVTGIAGSGPAYFMLFMEAMVKAATDRGLNRETAHALVVQTCRGAAGLAGHSDESLEQLRINVTSPGGTTERALSVMQSAGIDAIIRDAVNAAADRADELATTLAEK